MKKFFGLFVSLLFVGCLCFTSCSQEDEKSTYTLKWNSGTLLIDNVILFECSDCGDIIANNKVGEPKKGSSYKFTATSNASKIKVYFESGGSPRWVQQVYYLNKGGNVDIVIEGNTLIGRKEP